MGVLGDSDAKISSEVRAGLIETVVAAIETLPRDQAVKLGTALADTARSERATVAAAACRLIRAPATWAQLIGWTTLAELGDDFPIEEFIVAATSFAEGFPPGFGPSLLGGIRIASDSGRELLQRATLAAIELALKTQTPEDAAARFRQLLEHEVFNSWGFTQDLHRFFPDVRVRQQFKQFEKLTWPKIDFAPEEFKRANRAAGAAILNAILAATGAAGGLSDIQHDGAYGQLSAVFAAARYGESIPREAYAFERDCDAAGLAEVFKGLIGLIPVDPARLRAEVISALPFVAADDEGWAFWNLNLPTVDIAKPDWDRANELELDEGKLLASLSLKAPWIITMAAELLRARGHLALPTQKRLLATETGYGLAAVAYIVAENGEAEAEDMLVETLATRRADGLQHVITALDGMHLPWTPRMHGALEPILLGADQELARSAAKLMLARAEAGDELDAVLFENAYAHWLKTEKPYPTGGGVIPESPRAVLLAARIAGDQMDLPGVIACLRDPRSDVTAIASGALERRLAEGRDIVATVDAILAKEIGPAAIRKLLAKSPALRPHAERLRALANDGSAAYRLASVPLFSKEYGLADAKAVLERLADDGHREVADAARSALEDFADE